MDVRRHERRGVHGVAGQPCRDYRAARDQAGPGRLAAGPRVDRQRLHPDLRGAAADGRRTGRPLRAQAHVRHRAGRVHAGSALAALAPTIGTLIARPRPPGSRRRHRDATDADDPVGRGAAGSPRRSPSASGAASPASPSPSVRSSAAPWSKASPGSGSSGSTCPSASCCCRSPGCGSSESNGPEPLARPARARPRERRPARHRLGPRPRQRGRLDEPRRRRPHRRRRRAWSRFVLWERRPGRPCCRCASSAAAPSRPPTSPRC